MNSYVFLGRILPERLALNIPKVVFNELRSPDHPSLTIGDLTIEAIQGGLTANLITPQSFHLATIKNSIEFYVRVIVDSYGYYTGQAFDVDIELVSGPEGAYTFSPRVNSIYNNQHDRPLTPEAVLHIAAGNMNLLRALGNLREAIKHPVDTGLFCYRAVENIRQHFVEGGNRAQSWTRTHQALNTSQNFVDAEPSLTAHSEQARHGETNSIESEAIEKMLGKTWIIVDRFCVYLSNGETQLDVHAYPML